MSIVEAIIAFLNEVWSLLWYGLIGPMVREAEEERRNRQPKATSAADDQIDVATPIGLVPSDRARHLGRPHERRWQGDDEEDDVTDSFLQQLEQRTQQVKITLANLEAERTRIEGLISRLQPIVPQYDALLDAERALQEAQVTLEGAGAQREPPPSWEEQHAPQQEHGWGG